VATTNNDGVDEVYIPLDEFNLDALPPLGQVLDEEIEGHVAMVVDPERPYSGHMIDVRVQFTVERKGKVSVGEPVCEVTHVMLRSDSFDEYEEENIPLVSLAQALADETGLSLSEADELVDAESLVDESDDGLVYGYIFDFSHDAPPAVARKLMRKYGSLSVRVPPSFFERVESPG